MSTYLSSVPAYVKGDDARAVWKALHHDNELFEDWIRRFLLANGKRSVLVPTHLRTWQEKAITGMVDEDFFVEWGKENRYIMAIPVSGHPSVEGTKMHSLTHGFMTAIFTSTATAAAEDLQCHLDLFTHHHPEYTHFLVFATTKMPMASPPLSMCERWKDLVSPEVCEQVAMMVSCVHSLPLLDMYPTDAEQKAAATAYYLSRMSCHMLAREGKRRFLLDHLCDVDDRRTFEVAIPYTELMSDTVEPACDSLIYIHNTN